MNHTQLHNALADVITGVKNKKMKPTEASAICKASNEMLKLHDKEVNLMKTLGVTVDLPLFGLSKMQNKSVKQLKAK